MVPGRNDACPCGSGRKYKHCHGPIDQAPPQAKYAAAQAVYAANWRTTAEHHYRERSYHWLAEQLKPFNVRRLLDVGCGSGHGLLGLFETLDPLRRVIALDENLDCLRTTAATLAEQRPGQIELAMRMASRATPAGYEHIAGPIPGPFTKAVTLLESDVCNDPYLGPALLADGPFDAVTIWLTGVHMLRQQNVQSIARRIHSDSAHRLYVQNAVYRLADQVLRPGGVLQVADRGEAPDSPALREEWLRGHREQASITSLKVQALAFRPYKEPDSRRTPMLTTVGRSAPVPTDYPTAIISVISVKP